jgi:hypothetical protein
MQVLSQQISPGEFSFARRKTRLSIFTRAKFPSPGEKRDRVPCFAENQNFEELPPTNLNTS